MYRVNNRKTRSFHDKTSKSAIQLLGRLQAMVLSSLTLGLFATEAQVLTLTLAAVATVFALTDSYIILYFATKKPTRLFDSVEQRLRWTEPPSDDCAE